MKDWHMVKGFDSAIKENDMFAIDARSMAVVTFVNENTGEIKMFSKNIVDRIGLDRIEEIINK